MKQIISKEEYLTVGELKNFINELPNDIKIIVYNIGINEEHSWKSDVIDATLKDNILEIDFSTFI